MTADDDEIRFALVKARDNRIATVVVAVLFAAAIAVLSFVY